MGTNWNIEARRVSRACAVGTRNVAVELCSSRAQERRGRRTRVGGIWPAGQSLPPLWRLDSSCPPRRSQQGAVLVPWLPNGPSAFGQAELHAVIYRARRNVCRSASSSPDVYARCNFCARQQPAQHALIRLSPTHDAVDFNNNCNAVVAFLWFLIPSGVSSNRTLHFVGVGLARNKMCNTLKC